MAIVPLPCMLRKPKQILIIYGELVDNNNNNSNNDDDNDDGDDDKNLA